MKYPQPKLSTIQNLSYEARSFSALWTLLIDRVTWIKPSEFCPPSTKAAEIPRDSNTRANSMSERDANFILNRINRDCLSYLLDILQN